MKNLKRVLSMSAAMKRKNGWTRENGAGFIAEDILEIRQSYDPALHFVFGWGKQDIRVSELNLRETEEALRFIYQKELEIKIRNFTDG